MLEEHNGPDFTGDAGGKGLRDFPLASVSEQTIQQQGKGSEGNKQICHEFWGLSDLQGSFSLPGEKPLKQEGWIPPNPAFPQFLPPLWGKNHIAVP